MELLDELVGGGRDVGERDPGVLVGGQAVPVHEVLVALAKLAAVEDGVDSGGRVVVGELERLRRGMGMEFGRVVIRFKKGDVEDGVNEPKGVGEIEGE